MPLELEQACQRLRACATAATRHVLDVPMAGKIRAAVTLAQPAMQPLTQVHMFVWPKALAFGRADPQRAASVCDYRNAVADHATHAA
jgi:hypothetical protein